MIILKASISSRCLISYDTALITLRILESSAPWSAKPGQFILIQYGDNPPIPRSQLYPGWTAPYDHATFNACNPIPIYIKSSSENTIDIVFRAVDAGTNWLIIQPENTILEIFPQPLGNGFEISPDKSYLLVGDDINIPPLYAAALEAKAKNCFVTTILYFSNKHRLLMLDNFSKLQVQMIIAIDDSGYGYGLPYLIEEVLRDFLSGVCQKPDAILACLSAPMLPAITKIHNKFQIPYQFPPKDHKTNHPATAAESIGTVN